MYKIAIMGANGTVGSRISAIFAAFGNAEVYMLGRSLEGLKKAVNIAKKSVRSDIIQNHLHILTYDNCADVLNNCDLIIESVFEDLNIKNKINKIISQYVNDKCIIATTTSGLSINELSKDFNVEQRKRYLGLHFFNPPYNMTLCEIIPNKLTLRSVVLKIKNYLQNSLYRTTVFSKDEPAFIANRIGFNFINACLLYAKKYEFNGGIDYIDSIFGCFTGRNMPPLATADFVGLDIHKSIVDNIYNNTNDFLNSYFIIPDFLNRLILDGKLGIKTSEGLYKTYIDDNDIKHDLVFSISEERYVERKEYKFDFASRIINYLKFGNYEKVREVLLNDKSSECQICMELLSMYVIYSIYVGNTVGNNVNCCDDVMDSGFNWIPPFALVQLLGGKEVFFEYLKESRFEYLKNINLDEYYKLCPDSSNYDFRKYLKAKM